MDVQQRFRRVLRPRGSGASGCGPGEAVTVCCRRSFRIWPIVHREEIQEAIAKQLREDLDGEFGEFCEDDDYYEPVVEDYDFEYDMKQICPGTG